MPAMPRSKEMNAKATKIAYKVLGIPENIKYKRTPKEERVNKRLWFEETARAR